MAENLNLGDLIWSLGFDSQADFLRALDRTLDRAEDRAERSGREAGREFNSGMSRFVGAAALGGLVGGATAQAFGMATNVISDFTRDLDQRAIQIQASIRKANTVFGETLPTVRRWAEENANAMGLTTQQAVGLAASAQDLLVPMGFLREEAVDISTTLVGLSGALAEWSEGQRTSAEVSDILTSALLGERDALTGLGISISAADVEARLAAKGQAELEGAVRQQAEAQATLELILEKSTDAQQAFADGANEPIRKQQEAKAAYEEAKDALATALIPTMTGLYADVLPPLIEGMTTFIGWLSKILDRREPVVKALEAQQDALDDFRQRGDEATTAVKNLTTATDENGLRGAISDLSETLNTEGRGALSAFALNTVEPLIAQGKLQEAIDATIRKFVELRTEENAAMVASTNKLLSSALNQQRLITENITFFQDELSRATNDFDRGYIQEQLESEQVALGAVTESIAGYRGELEALEGPLGRLQELQSNLAAGLLSPAQAAAELLDAIGVGQSIVQGGAPTPSSTPTPSGSSASGSGSSSSSSGGGGSTSSSGQGRASTAGRAASAEKTFVEQEVAAVGLEVRRLKAVREANLISAEDYEAQIAGHFRRLTGIIDQAVTSQEQIDLLTLRSSLERELGSLQPEVDITITPTVSATTAATEVTILGQDFDASTGTWVAKGPQPTVTVTPEVSIPIPQASVQLVDEYARMLGLAQGRVADLVRMQERLGDVSRVDLRRALQDQATALESLLQNVREGSDDYFTFARALVAVRRELDSMAVDLSITPTVTITPEGQKAIKDDKARQKEAEEAAKQAQRELERLEAQIATVALSFPKALISGIRSGDVGGALKGALGSATDFFVERMIQGIVGDIAASLAASIAKSTATSAAGNAAGAAAGAASLGPAGLIIGAGLLGASLLGGLFGKKPAPPRAESGSRGSSGSPAITYTASTEVNVQLGVSLKDPATLSELRALAKETTLQTLRELGQLKDKK